ncbi:MAG: glucose-1-phosphate adenylyltransferase subunit GlgD [Bacteroidales bacterium]|nr:glucose-1-phosphate adenylyltransferase subunit GlgD [Candidatus Latescibacterota bacterium]
MKILTMILAGGRGRELSVLTRHRAKTSVPFGGRYRIIDFCLSNCVHSGLTDIAILAQYNPTSLMEHIRMGKPWDLDRRSGGVYIMQPAHRGKAANWYLGTADALLQNIDIIRNSDSDTVLVLSGDQVYLMDYRLMARQHAESNNPVTIACKAVSPKQRGRFGMVSMSKDGIVRDFQEKPVASEFHNASLGIYMFDRKYLLDCLSENKRDIVFDILMPSIERGDVGGYLFGGYWEDTGSIPSYFKASMRLLKNRSLITKEDWSIFTRGEGLAPAKFSARASVHDSIVADGCVIEGEVRGSILFPGVHIGRDVQVIDSIIFSGSRIINGSRVLRTIIDKDVFVGSDSDIGRKRAAKKDFLDPRLGLVGGDHGKNRISLIGKNTRLHSGCVLPAGSMIEPESRMR